MYVHVALCVHVVLCVVQVVVLCVALYACCVVCCVGGGVVCVVCVVCVCCVRGVWCVWCGVSARGVCVCVCCVSVRGVCGVCGVCVLCVLCVCAVWCMWRGLARGKPLVCKLKTSSCESSKRLRVYQQNARMCSTCARFASTHGGVLNLHTETFLTNTRGGRKEKGVCMGEGVLFSLFPHLFLSSVVLFLPSLLSSRSCHLFSSLLFSLSNIDNDHSSSRALCVHTRL